MALIDTHKVVKQFTTAGLTEKQAEAITDVISNIDQHVATKGDIARLEDKLELHMKWLMGVGIAILLMLAKLVFFV